MSYNGHFLGSNFIFILIYKSITFILHYLYKRMQALLESNLNRDNTDARQKCQIKGLHYCCSPFDIFREPYAFKNSSINLTFLFIDNPLWFRNLFFKSAKWPSIAFVVLGIFNSILSYHVNSQGVLFFKLRYALLNFLCV